MGIPSQRAGRFFRHDGRELQLGNAQEPVGFYVADTDEIAGRMTARGAAAVLGPVDYSGARIAILRDPDGHQIELIAK